MIKIMMIGNLGGDATIAKTANSDVLNFSIAHTEKRDNKEYTTWCKCAMWGDVEKLAPFLKKGKKIYVEGYPEAEAWKNNNGDAQATLKMNVIKLELLTPKESE